MLDPVRLQIAWSRAVSAVDEAAAVLIKTSVSTMIRESKDMAVVLFDARGNALAQSTVSIPSFLGTLPRTMRHFLARFPAAEWQPGDVVVTNDVWLGTGQLHDLNLATPIFHRGTLAGFAGVIGHMTDVGGTGLSAHASDTFEEGLHIPICHLYRAGQPQELVFEFLHNNVRLPDAVSGDVAAMISAARACSHRAMSLLESLGMDTLDSLGSQIISVSEAAMRQALRRIRPARYEGEMPLEGFAKPLILRMAVTVGDGEVAVDYTGTSPQVDRAINSTYAHTFAHTGFALKCILNPELPNNEGSFLPLRVTAPEGSILHARPPAACNSRTQVSHYISNLMFRVMGEIAPESVVAENGVPRPIVTFRGEHADGRPFSNTYPIMGGMGAGAHGDGYSTTAFATNTAVTPLEMMEHTVPLLFHEKRFLPGTGGPGRFRGGLGQRVRVEILSDKPVRVLSLPGRTQFAPRGLLGGQDGTCTTVRLNGQDIAWAGEAVVAQKGDILEVRSAGGGGYGEPAERDPERVARDREEGLVTD